MQTVSTLNHIETNSTSLNLNVNPSRAPKNIVYNKDIICIEHMTVALNIKVSAHMFGYIVHSKHNFLIVIFSTQITMKYTFSVSVSKVHVHITNLK